MPDFKFVQNPTSGRYVISAPKRAKRPDEAKTPAVCPFCPENLNEPELYRDGEVVVLSNKYPFAPIHEVIIHSNDHHKNFGELSIEASEKILRVLRDRFLSHRERGQVYIFHNRGEEAGESLFHPHSQLVVIPENVLLQIPSLELSHNPQEVIQTNNYYIQCPESSEWPDEVWIFPDSPKMFSEATDEEIMDLAKALTKVIKALEKKLGIDFPYNFYIYPKDNWYLRLTPRIKRLGGFEVGTGVSVNTEDPKETIKFLKEILV